MKFLALSIFIISIILVSSSPEPERKKSRRPTKARATEVSPPISCPDLYESTIEIGDHGPLIRKTQHYNDCKKYFECVTNRWIARDCPGGTTFSLAEKTCDSEKSCKPSRVTELYAEGIEELKNFLGIAEKTGYEI